MIAVVQRVSEALVMIDKVEHASIQHGFMILLGVSVDDVEADADYICKKILGLRVFADQDDKMNLALADVDGAILMISQFTLLANTQKGNRPSYIAAAPPDKAIPLYQYCCNTIENSIGSKLKTGVFGADMKVSLVNDGPVTIIINSKDTK